MIPGISIYYITYLHEYICIELVGRRKRNAGQWKSDAVPDNGAVFGGANMMCTGIGILPGSIESLALQYWRVKNKSI